jgi:DNA-binding MarR family transcriptional regulator
MNQDALVSSERAAGHTAGPPPLIAELVSEMRAYQRAVDDMDEAAAAHLGVNRSDLKCLDVLEEREPLTAGQLAEVTGLTTGAVTTLLDRLEAAGYVRRVRDTADRRRVLVELTPLARQKVVELYGPLGELGRKWFEPYGDDEVRMLIHFLRHGTQINTQNAARARAMTGARPTRAAETRLGSR